MGVVIGALSMRFRVLLSILCASFISTLVGVHVSAPYVRIGMIHVCTSLHIADISIVLNSAFPARLNMVWRAASTFPLVFLRWFVRFPLLLIVIPRYWYVSVKDHFRTNVRRPLFVFWGKAALSDTLHISGRTTPDRRVVSGFR